MNSVQRFDVRLPAEMAEELEQKVRLGEYGSVQDALIEGARALLQHDADEPRVRLGPLPGAAQLPAVDDVAVEDQLRAARVAEEVVHLLDLAVRRAEVDVGDDDGADVEDLLIHGG